jgi:2-(1,2-epoxy-1,2-dihydrophenyl)acetyl-CoA isomerase
MADDPVVLTKDGPVATVLLNRPDKLNALDEGMREQLAATLSTLAHDPTLRVAVITGAGRGFCSGGDLHRMAELKDTHQSVTFRRYLEAGNELVRKIRRLPKPVVACVNGPAAGAGLSLALACDLRIASDSATFTQAFMRVGLHPDWGGTFLLPRLIGIGRAIEMFALGEPVQAAEAHRLGLVNVVVPHDQLACETRRLAEHLAAAPALPLALLKQGLYERLETMLDLMMEYEVDAQMKCFDSQDFIEGLRAFVQKRAPNFRGTY